MRTADIDHNAQCSSCGETLPCACSRGEYHKVDACVMCRTPDTGMDYND